MPFILPFLSEYTFYILWCGLSSYKNVLTKERPLVQSIPKESSATFPFLQDRGKSLLIDGP